MLPMVMSWMEASGPRISLGATAVSCRLTSCHGIYDIGLISICGIKLFLPLLKEFKASRKNRKVNFLK